MAPQDELRAAAKVLRETAAKATPGPWGNPLPYEVTKDYRRDGERHVATWLTSTDTAHDQFSAEQAEGNAAWIALANPALAEPLAAWLEITADVMEWLGPVVIREAKSGAVHWDDMGSPRLEWDRAIDLARAIQPADEAEETR